MQLVKGHHEQLTYTRDWQVLNPPGVGVEHAKTCHHEENEDTNERIHDGKQRVWQGAANKSSHNSPVKRDWELQMCGQPGPGAQ